MERLEKLSEEFNIPFDDIRTSDEATEARHNHADSRKGIFLIARKFGMGYDLKLKEEAHVISLVND